MYIKVCSNEMFIFLLEQMIEISFWLNEHTIVFSNLPSLGNPPADFSASCYFLHVDTAGPVTIVWLQERRHWWKNEEITDGSATMVLLYYRGFST